MAQGGSTGLWKVGALLTKFGIGRMAPQFLSVNGAIKSATPGYYVITKAGVLADTLAAPPAVTKGNGIVIIVTSRTANAHTITATGLLNTGSAFVNVATFNANAGATLALISDNLFWNVLFANGVSFS